MHEQFSCYPGPPLVTLQMARDLRMLPVALLCMMASLLSFEVSDDVDPWKKGPWLFLV